MPAHNINLDFYNQILINNTLSEKNSYAWSLTVKLAINLLTSEE